MDQVSSAVEQFLRIADPTEHTALEDCEELQACLDRLLAAVHTIGFTFDPTDYPDPPKEDSASVRARISKAYPSLGLYNVALDVSGEIGATKLAVGDAIDDLVDVTQDLYEVQWRFSNTSKEDALFHLQLGYRTHWGRHARDLSLYIHDRTW